MTLRLKAALAEAGIKQGEFAQACGLSRSAANGYLNHGHLPIGVDRADLERRITEIVREHDGSIEGLFEHEKSAAALARDDAGSTQANTNDEEEVDMLLRKQALSQAARRHFELPRDPFGEVRAIEDVFFSGDIRYVRESMWSVVRHGGFLGVVGESGAGKSTLREELVDRIQREDQPTIVIQPYVLAMEDNDSKGKTLKAQHIAEAIMAAVAPLEGTKSSPEARFRQLHGALRESSRAGHNHVLIIEEAHSLPVPTLKHLKRFVELKDGLRPLLAVILLGQPELAMKLNENDPHVREVVQRIEIAHLPPLNADLEGYVKHRLDRIGVPMARVIESSALDALRTRLTPDAGRGARGQGSLLYPLVVHNVLAAAMNTAAELGLPRVTADLVKGV
jgi:type II secretory pathway predicted ATPase ExeA